MATKTKKIEIGCPSCVGGGYTDATKEEFCEACGGRGRVHVPESASKECPECKGRGQHEGIPCRPCAHTGLIAGDAVAAKIAEQKAAAEARKAQDELDAKLAEAREEGRQAGLKEATSADQDAIIVNLQRKVADLTQKLSDAEGLHGEYEEEVKKLKGIQSDQSKKIVELQKKAKKTSEPEPAADLPAAPAADAPKS